MTWMRLTGDSEKDPDSKNEDDEAIDNYLNKLLFCRRIYGKDGRLFPRIVVSVRTNKTGLQHSEYLYEPYEPAFIITASYKEAAGKWYEDRAAIPIELFDEVVDMLKEAKKVSNRDVLK